MILNNPFCDICGRYCEVDWYEVKAKSRYNYRGLKDKQNRTYIVCGRCKMALFDLIRERSLKESEEEE